MGEFRLGKKTDKQKYKIIIVGSAVIFAYYMVYDFLLVSSSDYLSGNTVLFMFSLIEVLFVIGSHFFTESRKKRFFYKIDKEKLTKVNGKKVETFYWKDFNSVAIDEYKFFVLIPIVYQVSGKPLMINPNIDKVQQLHSEIVKHIKAYVEITPTLKERIDVFENF